MHLRSTQSYAVKNIVLEISEAIFLCLTIFINRQNEYVKLIA